MRYFLCSLLVLVGAASAPTHLVFHVPTADTPVRVASLIATVLAAGPSTGNSYYVANLGDDSNDGASPSTAWKTLAKVNSQPFSPGDTIFFKRGDSWDAQADAPFIVSSSGSPGSPITYTSYDSGPLPIIDGQIVVGNVLQVISKSFVVIDSLQVQNSQNYLLYFNNCDSCSITNNTLVNGGLYGIEVTGASPNVTISGNHYGLTSGFAQIGPGIDCNTSSFPGCAISDNSIDLRNVAAAKSPSGILCRNSGTCTIIHNTIQMTNGDQGIGLKASGAGHMTGTQVVGNSITGIEFTSQCAVANGCDAEGIELTGYDPDHLVMNSLISGNYIKNSSGTSSDCIGVDRAASNTISYNICIAPLSQGSILHVSGPGTTNNLIYGNSAYGSQQGMTFLGTATTNNTVENNIVVGAKFRGINFQVGATGIYDYNLAWHNGTGVGNSDNYVGGTDGGHNLATDPQWEHFPPTSTSDVKLLGTSPAIDSGGNLGGDYEMANSPDTADFPYAQADQNLHGNWERGAFIYSASPGASAVDLNPATISFGSQTVGSNSAPLGIVLTNTGTASLNIQSLSITGSDGTQFSMTQTCSATLASSASCNVSVIFSPTSTGTKSAQVTMIDDASGSPHSIPLSGTANGPGIGLVPSDLSFGDQPLNTNSSARVITVTNTGTEILNVSSIAVIGADAPQFALTHNCGTPLAAGATCSISVIFSPTSTGAKSAAITITDDAAGSPHSIALAGTGTAPAAPVLTLAPSGLSFGNQTISTSSTPQSVTLSNTGNALLNITSITLAGTDAAQFSKNQTCTATLAAGATCSISITFSPTSTGAKSAAITITDDAAGSPHSVSLVGTGTAPAAPVVTLAPSGLSFGNQTISTSGTPQSVTLSNTGNALLNITSITLAGTDATQFSKNQTCTATLAAGATCSISITFSPSSTGAKSAAITITDDAAGSPHSVSLAGTGTAPAAPVVTLAPSGLSFGNQTISTSGTPQSVTLSNTGNALLNITSITVAGTDATQFSKNQTCIATLAAGASCSISITFSPTSTGTKSAAITITDDAPGSPHSVSLVGTGTAPAAPVVTLAPSGLSFGNQTISTSGTPQSVTLSNTGNALLNITSITVAGTDATQFSKNQTCIATLAAGASCSISVIFSPSSTGAKSAAIAITDDAAGSPHSVSLVGTGTAPAAPVVTLAPSGLSFGNQTISTSGTPQSVTLSNTGNALLNITSITITGTDAAHFSKNQTCTTTLAAGATCSISITFSPTSAGAKSAAITITNDATGSPHSVSLAGTGTAPAAPVLTLAPSGLSFGNQTISTSGTPQSVTLSNTGNALLNITSITLAGTDATQFSKNQTCTATLAAGATCSISITFSPTSTGTKSAAITITDDAAGSPHSVSLVGTGTAPAAPVVTLAPSGLSFGNQTISTSGTPQSVTLSNTGNALLNITSITITGTDAAHFSKNQTCTATLAAGATCSITVIFSPTSTGAKSAAITITDDAAGSPHSVSLAGTGTAPAAPVVTLAPAGLSFGNQTISSSSASQSVTLSNTGNALLNIASITITGTDAAQFSKNQTCTATLAAGATCSISVIFSPTSTGAKTAFLSLGDSAAGSPHTVSLVGTGTAPAAPVVTLAPSGLSFGNQTVSTSSASQAITLRNTGNASLNIASIAIGGTGASQFTKSQTCGATLAAGAACSISVAFVPTSVGTKTATITVADNAVGTPQSVNLTGNGIGTTATLSVTGLTFGTQANNTKSAPQSVILSNTGVGRLNINSITIGGTNPGDFSQTNNCGTSLAAKATCTITLAFTPAVTGTRSAILVVADDAISNPQTASLSGTGIAQVTLSSGSLNFGTLGIGSTSSSKNVTLTNNRSTSLTVTSIAIGGINRTDFFQSNTCSTSVAARATCTISLTFKPSAIGLRTASMTITDNANNSPQTIALTGSGVVAVVISPTSLNFGIVTRGVTTAAKTVSVTNNKSTVLVISSIAISGSNRGDFSQTNTCGSSLPAQATCTISVKFKPAAATTRTATMTVTDDASNSPQTVSLSGTGK